VLRVQEPTTDPFAPPDDPSGADNDTDADANGVSKP
jgi:hypothetical protein